jgi:hypothetical protein
MSIDINKNFLANTIRAVESHNQRDQIEQCWRKHDAMKNFKRRRSDIENDHNSISDLDEERQYWALKKVESLKQQTIQDSKMELVNDKIKKEKKNKKEKKSKKEKKKKKVKKEKKRNKGE